MENLLEDKKFYDLLESKRHKDIVDSLKNILLQLQKEESDNGIADAILKQANNISNFVEAVKSLSPKVNVETNQDKVVQSLEKMCTDILEGFKDLKKSIDEKPKEWEFDVQRNYGLIYKVIAKAK